MNASPVVVFIGAAFECVMAAPTRDTAIAWASGAMFGARVRAGTRGELVAIVIPPNRCRNVASAMVTLKLELDEEMVEVEAAELDAARAALERVFLMQFSPLVTVVK